MLTDKVLFMGGELGIRAQLIMWREVLNEIRSWIIFVIGVLCRVKLALPELMGRLCAWVETLHAWFVIKARSNPRSPFKWT